MIKSHRSEFYKASILVFFGIILTCITEYGQEAAIAHRFGTSREADIFFGAFIIPLTIFILFSYLGKIAIIPAITEIQEQESPERFNALLSTLYFWLTILATGLLIIGLLFSEYFVKVSIPGASPDMWQKAINLQRPLFLFVFISGFVSLCLSTIQAKKHFTVPAFCVPVTNSLVILMIFYGSRKFGLNALPWSYIAGITIQFVILAVTASHFKLKWFPLWRFRDPYLRNITYLFAISLLSFGIRFLNAVIARILASFLEVGSIAIINYSSKLISGISFVSAGAIFTVSIPFLATLFLEKEIREIRSLISNNIITLTLILIPLTTIIGICHYEIISILFQRGSFSNESTLKTSVALIYFSLGLYPGAMAFILSAPFFAMKKPRVPMINSILMFLINISLAILLMRFMGVNGIALAASLTYIVSMIFLYVILQRKVGEIISKKGFVSIGKIIAASSIMTLIMFVEKITGIVNIFPCNLFGNILQLLVISGSGLLGFLLIARLVNIPEIRLVLLTFRTYFMPKKNSLTKPDKI
jgi:putative peptidoglycan lipid II flippase